VARWRITQATSFGALVAALSDEARKALADVYRVLSHGPLPGESLLQVEPLPGTPDTYTVPFAGAGFLVYVVDRQRRTVELVGMIWLGL
jgi:hypothetical protein